MFDSVVKLTKSINRKVGGQAYYKHIITIPNKILDELGWDASTKLHFVIDGKDLKIKRKKD